MSIEIRIFTNGEYGTSDARQVEEAMAALGYVRGGSGTSIPLPGFSAPTSAGPTEAEQAASETVVAPEGSTRKRGEASPGKARRTKAEIAEDEAAEAVSIASYKELPSDATSEQVAEAFAGIRSGVADRVDPDNQDDAATAAADAADEAAEADAGRDADKPLTVDDVKALAVEYQEKYGFEAVQEDGAKIFVEAVGAPPAGEPFWKFSILPTDQASLAKLAAIWRKAIDLNPLKRTVQQAG